ARVRRTRVSVVGAPLPLWEGRVDTYPCSITSFRRAGAAVIRTRGPLWYRHVLAAVHRLTTVHCAVVAIVAVRRLREPTRSGGKITAVDGAGIPVITHRVAYAFDGATTLNAQRAKIELRLSAFACLSDLDRGVERPVTFRLRAENSGLCRAERERD